MTGSRPTPPNGHPVQPRPDPLQMTPGEKVAAEWEARHVVRAQGAHGNPATVQEYLRHARSEEQQHPFSARQHAAAPHAAQPPQSPPRAEAPRRSWLHRLFHRSGT